MKDSDVYLKTAAGLDEVRDRGLKLPQRLRTMLIMVDGTRSVGQLREAARTLAAPDDFLDSLIGYGLVEPDYRTQQRTAAAPPSTPVMPDVVLPVAAGPAGPAGTGERFRATLKFMNDSAVDLLGLRAFFITLKLEKCFTAADLLALMPEFTQAIAKKSGAEMARALEERARKMLE